MYFLNFCSLNYLLLYVCASIAFLTILILSGARWQGNYFPYGNGTLAIRDVSLNSDGYYDCVAMNKAGKNSARIYIGMFYVTCHNGQYVFFYRRASFFRAVNFADFAIS